MKSKDIVVGQEYAAKRSKDYGNGFHAFRVRVLEVGKMDYNAWDGWRSYPITKLAVKVVHVDSDGVDQGTEVLLPAQVNCPWAEHQEMIDRSNAAKENTFAKHETARKAITNRLVADGHDPDSFRVSTSGLDSLNVTFSIREWTS